MRRTLAAAVVAAGALLLAAVVPTAPAASAATSETGTGTRYVVRALPGHLDAVRATLHEQGIEPTTVLAALDSLVVELPPGAAASLATDTDVAAVTPDSSVQLLSTNDYDPTSDTESMAAIAHLLNADDAWAAGATGDGVDVALIDSGVTPVQGLSSGQVVNGPDLSFESQQPGTRYLDTFGHGTFMAGLIAGNDPAGTVNPYRGIAPDARVVSLKVADSHGRTDVSQVIAAIDWVVQHAHSDGLNIRVLNLSFGTDSTQSYLYDPLAYAAEVAWHKGIVVVASSGNNSGSTLADPAMDPFLIAVGALDTNKSLTAADDEIASFTAVGGWRRHIDLLAPGVHVQGLRVPGSFVDIGYGNTARLGNRFFRGSGTSQAAALTSGVVALMLQKRPNLDPDEVKGLLTGTDWLPSVTRFGTGVVDAYKATFTGRAWFQPDQDFPWSRGTGTLQGSRGSVVVNRGQALIGERDIFGNPVDTGALAALEAKGASWAGGSWNGATWAGATWAASGWAGASWTGALWDGASWNGASWGGASWKGASWNGATWTGASWNGASWNGASWDGASWDGASWDGASWDGASWDGASWDGASWNSAGWLGQGWR